MKLSSHIAYIDMKSQKKTTKEIYTLRNGKPKSHIDSDSWRLHEHSSFKVKIDQGKLIEGI